MIFCLILKSWTAIWRMIVEIAGVKAGRPVRRLAHWASSLKQWRLLPGKYSRSRDMKRSG